MNYTETYTKKLLQIESRIAAIEATNAVIRNQIDESTKKLQELGVGIDNLDEEIETLKKKAQDLEKSLQDGISELSEYLSKYETTV